MRSLPLAGVCPGSVRILAVLALVLAACTPERAGVPADVVPDVPYVTDDGPASDAPDGSLDDASGNRPPALARVGDRVVAVGETLTIRLVATDPDQDALTCSVHGDLPDGARFDKPSCTLSWVPLKAGLETYLTFVVSDGRAIDRETVLVKVVAERQSHPPVLVRLSDLGVEPGVPVLLQLEAHDPDGDPLTFRAAAGAPAGSTLDASTGRFGWTPGAEADGTVVTVSFEVRDPGGLADAMDVRFVVGAEVRDGPPVFDPVSPMTATVGVELGFTVRAVDPEGGAVTISLVEGLPAEAFEPATGVVRWTPAATDGGRQIEAVFAASDGTFEAFLRVPLAVVDATSPPTCEDDEFEPNNAPDAAPRLSPGEYDLSICDSTLSPLDEDWFLLTVQRDETVTVRLAFDSGQGDLDIDLSADGSTDTVLAESKGTADIESLSWKATEGTAEVYLAVYGVASAQYSAPYHLLVSVQAPKPSCPDDAFTGNQDAATALMVENESEVIPGLVACSTEGYGDWFAFWLGAGDSFLASVTPTDGTITVAAVDPDGGEVMTDGPSASTALVGAGPVTEAGIWFARVSTPDPVAATYVLEYLVERKAQ